MLVFLKLGGSLITDKNKPNTARKSTIARLANEIHSAKDKNPDLQLVIGHGSGSFGHTAGKVHGTRDGVHTAEQWKGFVEVWKVARDLNQIMIEGFLDAGLPVISLPPSAFLTSDDLNVVSWNHSPIRAALEANLMPLVFGDVLFDKTRGGTIISTEEIFFHLANDLRPDRILLAGLDKGVWSDYPTCEKLIKEITPQNYEQVSAQILGSSATDVTGGMTLKVQSMLALVQQLPDSEIVIFSGDRSDNLYEALTGATPGTVIKA